ncbi:hypothetical protein KKB83_03130 [Patescibacteria group bacterium]|nr:hypothetical protein [Patescibacteria group bacterium]
MKNLNEDLYIRFGLQLEREQVESGFRKYLNNAMTEAFHLINSPYYYEEEFSEPLKKARKAILDDCSKELFLNRSRYDTDYGIVYFLRDVFEEECSFEELLIRSQVVINVFWKHEILHEELEMLTKKLQEYLDDYPILGITIKGYKTKAPQVLPSTSKQLDKEIKDTLDILDTKQFEPVLNEFEAGLKLFAKAKTTTQLKDVVEDMHGSCDEIVKIILGNKAKSFKSAYDKDDFKKLGLDGKQKEIFKQLKLWIDDIKHGSKSRVTRGEVEMIISMVAAFIRFVALNHQ